MELSRYWFEPGTLFRDGYPDGLSSPLRELTGMRERIRDHLVERGVIGRGNAVIEVGPGDCPIAPVDATVFLDAAIEFLARLDGAARVVGDLLSPPFAPHSFDTVIASDVLTHIEPPLRPRALHHLAELGGTVCLFNPEPGTPEVPTSPVDTHAIETFFRSRGYELEMRHFSADLRHLHPGERDRFDMALIIAAPPQK